MEDDGIKNKAMVIAKNMGRKKIAIKKRRCTTNGKSISTIKKVAFRAGPHCSATTDPSLIFSQ